MARVLLVGKGEPERGGIPSFLRSLLDSDLARSHELTFLNVAHGGTTQGGRATASNVRRTVGDAVAVWQASREQDVVHIHSALAPTVTLLRAGLMAAAARARGARVVVHAHGGLLLLWMRRGWQRRAARLALAPARRVLAVSQELAAALEGALGSGRVSTVDNGVDTVLFTPGAPSPAGRVPRVLYVGVLTPRKGLLDLLTASSRLLERGVPHELWLAGGRPSEGSDSEQAVLSAAGQPHVRLLGEQSRERMPALYREVDVLCLPSWWEAMPLSVLEGMASGLPAVATRVGDVPRLVRSGVTGELVAPRAPEELADALQRLLTDRERRTSQGVAARALVATAFSSRETARAVSAAYEEVLTR